MEKRTSCKRPYSLGKRLDQSAQKRARILAVARAQLESNGFRDLTLDGLARESGVTRQTIHNLFGTRSGLLESLFDQLAMAGGMSRMAEVMQQGDPAALLPAFVKVFTDFWRNDRLFIRRIHGIAAIDPELGAAVEARNRRRHMASARIVDRLGAKDAEERTNRITALYALTSFEFFDAAVESSGSAEQTVSLVLELVKREFGI